MSGIYWRAKYLLWLMVFFHAVAALAVQNGATETDHAVREAVFRLVRSGKYTSYVLGAGAAVGDGVILTAAHNLQSLSLDPQDIFGPENDGYSTISRVVPGPFEEESHFFYLHPGRPIASYVHGHLMDPHFDNSMGRRDDLAAITINFTAPFHSDESNEKLEHDIRWHAMARPIHSRGKILQSAHFALPKSKTDPLPQELFISGFGRKQWFDNALRRARNESQESDLQTIKIDSRANRLYALDSHQACFDSKNYERCMRQMADANRSLSEGKLICFAVDSTEQSPMAGDSGGPLYSRDANGGMTVWGIYSFASWEGTLMKWYCYTSVQAYLPWIKNQLQTQRRSIKDEMRKDFKITLVSQDGSTRTKTDGSCASALED